MSATRDEFELIGFMKFYMWIQVLAPLALMGILLWAINQPNMELADKGPLILAVLGAWALWEIYKMIKWSGFAVTVTDKEITVGKQSAPWSEIESANVQAAMKFSPWITLQTKGGETMNIPAAIQKKDQLITLVEKHHPQLVKG